MEVSAVVCICWVSTVVPAVESVCAVLLFSCCSNEASVTGSRVVEAELASLVLVSVEPDSVAFEDDQDIVDE